MIETTNPASPAEQPISKRLADNMRRISDVFRNCDDFQQVTWKLGDVQPPPQGQQPEQPAPDGQQPPQGQQTEQHPKQIQAAAFFFETLTYNENRPNAARELLNDMIRSMLLGGREMTAAELAQYLDEHNIPSTNARILSSFDETEREMLSGKLVVFIDGWDKAIAIEAGNPESRSISEPLNESVIAGPHVGTVEDMRKNIGLLRGRLQTPAFKLKRLSAGGHARTPVAYGYIEGIVDPGMLQEFERRIAQIKDQEILEVSYVEEWLEDKTYSPFPQFRLTERPDTAVAALLSGKIIVMTQGSCGILLCPGLFVEFFQSSEDYYERTVISTGIRLLRILAVAIALTAPAIYIALVTYHPELIPTNLLLAIIDSREGIPFPAVVEAVIMVFFFELLREAGIRLPKTVGSAVSIVGALVIGEAAINAGIASPIMVVVVALTGIASFAIPQYKIAIAFRILQFPLMLMTAVLGIFGLMICLLWIALHLTKLKVLGQPYFDPFAPLRPRAMPDVLLRARLTRPIHKTASD